MTSDAVLYEHEDGRYAVNPDTAGDPRWHRLGPVDLSGLAAAVAAKSKPAFVYTGQSWSELGMALEGHRLGTAFYAATAPDQEVHPHAQIASLSPDELADRCEAWLQSGGASNIVDAFESGYRLCESDRADVFPAPERSHGESAA